MEFVNMIRYLKIQMDDRVGIMLFRLFDRQNVGYFSYAEFTDIIDRKLRPNYLLFVREERERYSREGLNITYPKKEKPEIIYKDKIKYQEKVVVEEKIVKVKRPQPKTVKVVIREVSYPRMEPVNEKVKLNLINEKSG